MTIDDFIFKIFWKIKDEVFPDENGKCQLKTFLIPRFGKIGIIIWYILTHDGDWEMADKDENSQD